MTRVHVRLNMVARLAWLAVVLPLLGCDAKPDYTLSVHCADGYSTCPAGQPCPTPPAGEGCVGVPLDLEWAFRDAGVVGDATFPSGCTIWLPYPNAFRETQATCTCGALGSVTPPHDWWCPK
jgi:hypothetical protein